MNNTIKKLLSIALCGTMLTAVAGCSQGEEKQNKQIVANVEKAPEGYEDYFQITYGDWHSEYMLRMAAGGYSESNDAEIAKQYREQIIQYLHRRKLCFIWQKIWESPRKP